MAEPLDLDRLIEEGLTLYGQGDLDGALLIWEQVLGVDPVNEQATSYVDYVRMNYDMLTTDGGQDGAVAPFGIGDAEEPEYMIEISDGELPSRPVSDGKPAPMYMDPMDAGWYIEDEVSKSGRRAAATVSDMHEPMPPSLDDEEPQAMTLELEADEPPDPTPAAQRAVTSQGENFDDATREYEPRTTTKDPRGDFATPEPSTNEFASEGTPGFTAAQVTDVRRRDLGFVRSTQPSLAPPPPERRRPSQEPPELKMTLRTPTPPSGSLPLERPLRASQPPPSPDVNAFSLSYQAAELDLPAGQHPPIEPIEPDDLIASLPSPKPAHVTRDLPPLSVKPAERPSQPPASLTPEARRSALQSAFDSIDLDAPVEPPAPISPSAPTRDLGTDTIAAAIAAANAQSSTRDFGEKPTMQTSRASLDPLISAPTRELGLRPGRAAGDDDPTVTNLRAMREKVAPTVQMPFDKGASAVGEGTRADIVLPFDPIDARAAQILDEIDDAAPANEAKEDQTRRRITSLLERAQLWSALDLDRAVAAVDLALAEDPSSALGQKLIHRNRDVIMGVFQSFLGDLDRQPALARPLHELSSAPISPRAAFLLSRVDGSLSLDEILDVSGMPRLEAYRYLCQLFLRGILR